MTDRRTMPSAMPADRAELLSDRPDEDHIPWRRPRRKPPLADIESAIKDVTDILKRDNDREEK